MVWLITLLLNARLQVTPLIVLLNQVEPFIFNYSIKVLMDLILSCYVGAILLTGSTVAMVKIIISET